MLSQIPCGIVQPRYTITRYTDQIYKIVRFNRSCFSLPGLRDHSQDKHHDAKLDPSISRARSVVLQIALCNDWEYFFTGTLDQSKMDRYDLKEFNRSLSQWIRDRRKTYGSKIEFLLVPEMHKDGAWHIHGLLRGVPDSALQDFLPGVHPDKLCFKGYKWWPDYSRKFGFCSLGRIRNPVACAFYIAKYITEDLGNRRSQLGRHLYYASWHLARAYRIASLFGWHSALDCLLDHHYDFCSTGMTKISDNVDWTFPLQFDENIQLLDAPAPPDLALECPEVLSMVDDFDSFLQLEFWEV